MPTVVIIESAYATRKLYLEALEQAEKHGRTVEAIESDVDPNEGW